MFTGAKRLWLFILIGLTAPILTSDSLLSQGRNYKIELRDLEGFKTTVKEACVDNGEDYWTCFIGTEGAGERYIPFRKIQEIKRLNRGALTFTLTLTDGSKLDLNVPASNMIRGLDEVDDPFKMGFDKIQSIKLLHGMGTSDPVEAVTELKCPNGHALTGSSDWKYCPYCGGKLQ